MFTPLSAQQWNYETAAHLLNRAGFGGTPGEIEAARGKGLDATVRDLVDVSDDFANVLPPAWARPRTIGKIVTQMRSKKISPKERRERKRAFHDLEGENILDLEKSEKEHPNENWARELMELFTIGIGNYTEQDIRESARAFTGYRVNLRTQQFRFSSFQHDASSKTFMGRTGPFDGDDIIDTLLEKPACAQFIGRKIWRYFVEDDPSPETVNAMASRLRAHNYEIRPVLREIFSSSEFYSPHVMRSQIKSPVQFLIQTAKLLEIPLPPVAIAQNAMRQMGQILFAPPSVKGWDGGRAWISTSTLLFRYNFANYLINGDAMLPASVPEKDR